MINASADAAMITPLSCPRFPCAAARVFLAIGCVAASASGAASEAVPEPEAGLRTKPLVSFGAMLQAQADFGDGENDRTYVRRARVSAEGAWRSWSYGTEIDLADRAPGAGSSERVRMGATVLNWAPNDQLEFQLGRMDPVFGLETLIGDEDLVTVEPSRASDVFGAGWHTALAAHRQLPRGARGSFTVGRDEARRSVSSVRLEAPWFAPGLAPADVDVRLGIDALVARGAGDADAAAAAPRQAAGLDLQAGFGRWNLAAEWLAGRMGPEKRPAHGAFVALSAWVIPARLQGVVRRDTVREPGTGSAAPSWLAGVNLFSGSGRMKLMINHLWDDGSRSAHRTFVRWQAAF